MGIQQTHCSFDLIAACAGLSYGLAEATRILQLVRRPVLVVCAEKFSNKIGNVRPSRMIFGDGAAAIVVGPAPEGSPPDIEYMQTYASGPTSQVNSILWPNPAFANNITVFGPEVKALAGRYLMQMLDDIRALPDPDGVAESLLASIELIIPHQANKTMVIDLAKAAGLSPDQLYFNIERVGNASSASIPLAIHDAVRDQVITKPIRVFAPGFGAGAVAGYAVLRIDPAVIAPDDQAAPTGESAGVPESIDHAGGADMRPLPSDNSPHSGCGVEVSESRNCSTRWPTMAAGPGFCRSCPAWIVTRRASRMRAASSRLFAGGTALSWSPQTTRVGASMQPRTGMLDQVEMAAICQSKPNGSGRGHRVSRFGVSKSWVTSRGCPGTAPTPQAVASSTSRFTRVGWPTANCWATAPPWEYPTTSAFSMPTASRTRAAISANMGIEYGTTGVSLAPTPGRVKCNDSSVSKRVGEKRPALHRARHAVEQQHRITGSGGPRRNA